MNVVHLLGPKRDAILKKWLESTLASYPPETGQFLKHEQDRFLNPVGFTMTEEMGHLLDEILGKMEPRRIRKALEAIVRIRAVQELTPAVGACFPFLLKDIIRSELSPSALWGDTEAGDDTLKGLLELESRIDTVVATAFDIYAECREKICELRYRGAAKPKRD